MFVPLRCGVLTELVTLLARPVTAIALAVGLAACGGSAADESEGTESGAAMDFEVHCGELCELALACDPDEYAEDYVDDGDCQAQCLTEFDAALELWGPGCMELSLVVSNCKIDNMLCSVSDPLYEAECGEAQEALNMMCPLLGLSPGDESFVAVVEPASP
jgi:hypothetical protein